MGKWWLHNEMGCDDNYTGESFSIASSQKTIYETWNDNGFGIGVWSATISAEINSAPVVGGFVTLTRILTLFGE